MEGDGAWDELPRLVVKAVCDHHLGNSLLKVYLFLDRGLEWIWLPLPSPQLYNPATAYFCGSFLDLLVLETGVDLLTMSYNRKGCADVNFARYEIQ